MEIMWDGAWISEHGFGIEVCKYVSDEK